MGRPRISQHVIETLISATDNVARVGELVVEALISTYTPSPTTITGAGVSQMVVEALVSASAPKVRVSEIAVEALVGYDDPLNPISPFDSFQSSYGFTV